MKYNLKRVFSGIFLTSEEYKFKRALEVVRIQGYCFQASLTVNKVLLSALYHHFLPPRLLNNCTYSSECANVDDVIKAIVRRKHKWTLSELTYVSFRNTSGTKKSPLSSALAKQSSA